MWWIHTKVCITSKSWDALAWLRKKAISGLIWLQKQIRMGLMLLAFLASIFFFYYFLPSKKVEVRDTTTGTVSSSQHVNNKFWWILLAVVGTIALMVFLVRWWRKRKALAVAKAAAALVAAGAPAPTPAGTTPPTTGSAGTSTTGVGAPAPTPTKTTPAGPSKLARIGLAFFYTMVFGLIGLTVDIVTSQLIIGATGYDIPILEWRKWDFSFALALSVGLWLWSSVLRHCTKDSAWMGHLRVLSLASLVTQQLYKAWMAWGTRLKPDWTIIPWQEGRPLRSAMNFSTYMLDFATSRNGAAWILIFMAVLLFIQFLVFPRVRRAWWSIMLYVALGLTIAVLAMAAFKKLANSPSTRNPSIVVCETITVHVGPEWKQIPESRDYQRGRYSMGFGLDRSKFPKVKGQWTYINRSPYDQPACEKMADLPDTNGRALYYRTLGEEDDLTIVYTPK